MDCGKGLHLHRKIHKLKGYIEYIDRTKRWRPVKLRNVRNSNNRLGKKLPTSFI